MSKLTSLFVGGFPVLVILVGSYLAHTALNSFWAAQPGSSDPRTGWQRLGTTEFGKRYRRGHAMIVVGLVLLVGVIAYGVIAYGVAVFSDRHG
jgi:hypothetical protein